MNILVVEDNPSHLKLARLVLSAAGHKVSDAEAAEQAFNSIKQEEPKVILLDLILPDMDGLALVRKLKADPETRDIHVIVVTAYPDDTPNETSWMPAATPIWSSPSTRGNCRGLWRAWQEERTNRSNEFFRDEYYSYRRR